MSEAAALLDAEGVGYSMEVVLGEPGSMLLEMAEDLNADMVIMGARGMGALKSAIVGSVSKTVITTAVGRCWSYVALRKRTLQRLKLPKTQRKCQHLRFYAALRCQRLS